MLCQIEHCCRYADRTGRTVVVDTDYHQAEYFRDTLQHYFEPAQERLVLDAAAYAELFESQSVFPESLAGRIHTYRGIRDFGRRLECDTRDGQPLQFDTTRDYPHQLLLHHQCGGGQLAVFALMRMRLSPALREELMGRLRQMGPDHVGVHVRHTDYRSNYRPLLEQLAKELPERVFVATDNAQVLKDFTDVLGACRIHSFSALPRQAGMPAHRRFDAMSPARVRRRNTDAILDLFMLALSSRLYLCELMPNRNGARYSGFSTLAHKLWTAKPALHALLGPRGANRMGLTPIDIDK